MPLLKYRKFLFQLTFKSSFRQAMRDTESSVFSVSVDAGSSPAWQSWAINLPG